MIRRPPRSTLFPTRRSSDLTIATAKIGIYRSHLYRVRCDMADAPRITVDELRKRMEAGEDFTIIDVRNPRSEEHTSELQSRSDLVCRLLLEKKTTMLYTAYM